MIYLDNAATSLYRPESVVRAVSEAMCSMGNVGRGTSESALGTVAQGAVRFSFGWFNTMEEAERAADAVREIAL